MINTKDIFIRKMIQEDYPVMTKWLSTKEVLEYYGDFHSPFTLEKVKKKYGPRVKGESTVIPYIVELNTKPIGFMQHYTLNEEKKKEFGYPATKTIYGIDQFIGFPTLYNKGIGTKMVSEFINYIAGSLDADIIILDPEVSNERAINCYEKCGFTKVKRINDGDNWLMEYLIIQP